MGSHWKTWNMLAAVAAVTLVAVGFAALFGVLLPGRGTTGQPTPTVSRTASPRVSATASATAHPGPVDWQQAVWPQGKSGPDNANLGPALAPSDGNIAYLCQPGNTPADNEQIWATQRFASAAGGATWTHLGDLPVARQNINTCSIAPDMTGGSALLVTISPASGATPRNFASFDSGATWRELASQTLYFAGDIASYQGKIYAIISTILPTYPQFGNYTLSVSSDQMRTWQPVSQTVVDAFWLNRLGVLLAHARDSRQFITSTDGGQTWHAFQNPTPFDTFSYVVQAPLASRSWMVCGLALPSGAPSSGVTHTAVCTTDTGQTYSTLPNLPDTPAGAPDPAGDMRLIGITGDGSVLAMLATQATPKGQSSSAGYTLWRLPPGATSWQSLGITPQYGVRYAPGVLYAAPDSQVIMRSCASCQADESSYVAAYP